MEPIVQPQEEPIIESQEEHIVEPQEESIVEPQEEPIIEPQQQPIVEPQQEPIIEPQQEPFSEPQEEPIVEPQEEPIVEPQEEPIIESQEEPILEPQEEPIVEAQEEPIIEIQEPIIEPQDDLNPSNPAQSPDYFPLPFLQQPTQFVKGQCTEFISAKEEQERGHDEFEKYPFKPMAKYFRNQLYTDPSRIRTPEALYESLQYLKHTFFVSILNDKKKIQKIISDKKANSLQQQNPSDPSQNTKRLQKILSILLKQAELGLVEQTLYYPFNSKNTKTSSETQDKLKNLITKRTQLDRFLDLLLPEKILVFLETRLQAIRCQLYAQAIVYPALIMEMLKCQIFLYTLKENECSGVGSDINSHQTLKLIGLDTLLDPNVKQTLFSRKDFLKIYHQALAIAIFRYNTHQLTKLIDTHDEILSNPTLFDLFQLRLYIERGNYHQYFTYLRQSEDILAICMLLTYLEKIRQRLCDVLKSAKIDVKKNWLAFLLGLTIKPEQENQIFNLNKNCTYLSEKRKQNQIEPRQKQLKNWFKLQDLFDQLILSKTQPSSSQLIVNDP